MGRIIQNNDINSYFRAPEVIRWGCGGTAEKLAAAKMNLFKAILTRECGARKMDDVSMRRFAIDINLNYSDEQLAGLSSVTQIRNFAQFTLENFKRNMEEGNLQEHFTSNNIGEGNLQEHLTSSNIENDLDSSKISLKEDSSADVSQKLGTIDIPMNVNYDTTNTVDQKVNIQNTQADVQQEIPKESTSPSSIQKNLIESKDTSGNNDISTDTFTTMIDLMKKSIDDAITQETQSNKNCPSGKLIGEFIGVRDDISASIHSSSGDVLLHEDSPNDNIDKKAASINKQLSSIMTSEEGRATIAAFMLNVCKQKNEMFSPDGLKDKPLSISLQGNTDGTVTLSALRGDTPLLTGTVNEKGDIAYGNSMPPEAQENQNTSTIQE